MEKSFHGCNPQKSQSALVNISSVKKDTVFHPLYLNPKQIQISLHINLDQP